MVIRVAYYDALQNFLSKFYSSKQTKNEDDSMKNGFVKNCVCIIGHHSHQMTKIIFIPNY